MAMELHYRTATIRFCSDLTDPTASTVPVAVFVAVSAPGFRLAGVATHQQHPLKSELDDPVAAGIIGALNQILRAQVEDAVRNNGGSLKALFDHLCDSFRSTLYMSGVSDEHSQDVDAEDAPGCAFRLGHEALMERIAAVDRELAERGEPEPDDDCPPATELWQFPRPRDRSDAEVSMH